MDTSGSKQDENCLPVTKNDESLPDPVRSLENKMAGQEDRENNNSGQACADSAPAKRKVFSLGVKRLKKMKREEL